MKSLVNWRSCVRTPDELVEFVHDVGFCTISRLEGLLDFPSQDEAMGQEDSLGNTWFWKDDLHIAKQLFYTRIFRKRPGYLAINWVPVFIATNGCPADELIFTGKMTVGAREIYETIERHGPISSVDLGKMISGNANKGKTNALIELERRFVVAKVNITGRDMWNYGYVWNLAERWMPKAFEEADRIGQVPAARQVVARMSEMGLEVTPKLMNWLLGWEQPLLSAALEV